MRKDIFSNTNFNYKNNTNINNASTIFKPSSDWRKGEIKTIFDVEDNNNKYSNNQNINNYHYNQHNIINKNINNNYEFSKNYIDRTATISNEELALKGKEKLRDDLLYPKQNKIINYHKDNI